MDEKRIKEILNDPNTWEWDGCTYPEDNPYSKDFEENLKKYFDQFKELKSA